MEHIAWILTILSVIGVILNSQKKVSGFYFWLPSNVGWIVVDIHRDLYAQAALFVFYTIMCIYGIYKWKKNK